MGLFGLICLFVALVLIGVGIAVGLVVCGLAAILLGLGVVSSSLIIGLRSGRPAPAIRAFLLQCGILAGIPAGAFCAWIAQPVFASDGSSWPILGYGAIGGALAGVTLALSLDFLSHRLHAWASTRFLSSDSNAAKAIERRS